MAQFYNTTGASKCPPDKFAAIDPKKLAADLEAAAVYINPTPQTARRHWVMDQLWVFVAGEPVDFYGVKATWMASMSPEAMKDGVDAPYTPMEIHRDSKHVYAKGSTVFLMRTPEGKTYVMQSYATEVDKTLRFDPLTLAAQPAALATSTQSRRLSDRATARAADAPRSYLLDADV